MYMCYLDEVHFGIKLSVSLLVWNDLPAMRFIVLYLVLLMTLCSCICSLGLDELIILFSLYIFVWTCEVLF